MRPGKGQAVPAKVARTHATGIVAHAARSRCTGTRLVPGQVISATAEDVDVDLEDGSVIRLKKGAKVRVDG